MKKLFTILGRMVIVFLCMSYMSQIDAANNHQRPHDVTYHPNKKPCVSKNESYVMFGERKLPLQSPDYIPHYNYGYGDNKNWHAKLINFRMDRKDLCNKCLALNRQLFSIEKNEKYIVLHNPLVSRIVNQPLIYNELRTIIYLIETGLFYDISQNQLYYQNRLHKDIYLPETGLVYRKGVNDQLYYAGDCLGNLWQIYDSEQEQIQDIVYRRPEMGPSYDCLPTRMTAPVKVQKGRYAIARMLGPDPCQVQFIPELMSSTGSSVANVSAMVQQPMPPLVQGTMASPAQIYTVFKNKEENSSSSSSGYTMAATLSVLAQSPFIVPSPASMCSSGSSSSNMSSSSNAMPQISQNSKGFFVSGWATRTKFFEEITGCDENQLLGVKDFRSYPTWDQNPSTQRAFASMIKRQQEMYCIGSQQIPKNVFYIKNCKTGEEFKAGYFETYTIKELRAMTDKVVSNKQGVFNFVNGVNDHRLRSGEYVDSGYMQSHPFFKDAVFQVASNFNCLETTTPDQNMDTEHRLTDYPRDHTQGPAAAISAAPGIIFRNYFMFYHSGGDVSSWRQSNVQRLDLLDNLRSKKVSVGTAGWVDLRNVGANKISATDADVEQMKIAFQGDIQVTYGFMKDDNEHYRLATGKHNFINQVYTAAVYLGSYVPRDSSDPFFGYQPYIQSWAQKILEADYEGTLRGAVAQGKTKVVLTFMGGGVFGNSMQSIAQAIARMTDFIRQSGLQVYLISYTPLRDSVAGTTFGQMVHSTNGRWYNTAQSVPWAPTATSFSE